MENKQRWWEPLLETQNIIYICMITIFSLAFFINVGNQQKGITKNADDVKGKVDTFRVRELEERVKRGEDVDKKLSDRISTLEGMSKKRDTIYSITIKPKK
jgi:hypothetical protein